MAHICCEFSTLIHGACQQEIKGIIVVQHTVPRSHTQWNPWYALDAALDAGLYAGLYMGLDAGPRHRSGIRV